MAIAGYLVAAYVLDVTLLRNLATRTTTWLTPLHPLLVLEAQVNKANYRAASAESLADRAVLVRFYLGKPFAAFSAVSLLVSTGLILWCTVFVRRMVQTAGTGTWLGRWLRLNSGEGRERRHPPRRVRGNPIAWREAHTRGNRAGSIMARWGFVLLAITAALVALVAYHYGKITASTFRDMINVLLLLELAVVVMVAIFMSVGSVSSEREDGTLDLILTTPITPKQYIWGKLRGQVRFLVLLLGAPIMTITLLSIYTMAGTLLKWTAASVTDTIVGGTIRHLLILPEAPLVLTAILVPFVALCVMAGMNWSLKSKGVMGAVAATVAIIGAASMVMGLYGLQMAHNVPLLGPVVNSFSPATSMAMLINPWQFVYRFSEEPVLGRIVLVVSALIAAGGYSLIVYTMLLSMVRGFDHTVRKLTGTG